MYGMTIADEAATRIQVFCITARRRAPAPKAKNHSGASSSANPAKAGTSGAESACAHGKDCSSSQNATSSSANAEGISMRRSECAKVSSIVIFPSCYMGWMSKGSSSSGKFSRFCGYFDLLTRLDKRRNTDFYSGFQFGGLRHVTSSGIAANCGLRIRNVQLHVRRQLQPDGIAVVLFQFYDCALDQKIECVAHHISGQGKRLKALLIQEVGAISITVKVRRLHRLQVGIFELVTSLEGLVKYCTSKQVPHLQANQRLAAPRCWRIDFCFQADKRGVLELEVHLSLYVDGVDQCGHDSLDIGRSGLSHRSGTLL